MASRVVGRKGLWSLWAWWFLLFAMWGALLWWAMTFWWMNYFLDEMESWMNFIDPAKEKTKTDWMFDREMDLVCWGLPGTVIAIFGALYFSLPRTPRTSTWKWSRFWSSFTGTPLVLPWPLGVVTIAESFCCFLTLCLMAWGTWMWFKWGYDDADLLYREGTITKKEQWQLKWDHNAGTIGWVSFYPFMLLFFPVTRRSVLLQLMGVQYEQAVVYHRWLAHTMLFLGTVHGILFWVLYVVKGEIYLAWEWKYDGISNLAGSILIVIGIVIWTTSIGPIRRKYFEVFFYTHYLYLLFVLFYVLHVGVYPATYAFAAFTLFFLDRMLRFVQSRNEVDIDNAKVLPGGYMSLDIPSNSAITYPSSALVFLNIPALSSLQWHAFSVTSISDVTPDTITVIAKPVGEWTDGLAKLPLDNIKARVEGPYFPARSTLLERYDALILVAAGSGITPFLSTLKELVYRHAHPSDKECSLPLHITLVWVVRRTAELEILDTLRLSTIDPNYPSKLSVKVQLYVTGEGETPQETSTLGLLPKEDQAVTRQTGLSRRASIVPRFGSSSWLAELFLIFVMTAGTIMTIAFFYRAIIYAYEHTGPPPPLEEDHDHEHMHDGETMLRRNFSTAGKALVVIFALWLGVFVSTAVSILVLSLLGKRQDGSSPIHKVSKDSGDQGVPIQIDDEKKGVLRLVSSIRETAQVSFQGRPNWSDTMLKISKELANFDSVGLFVSGPPSMQRSLAWEAQKRSIFTAEKPHFDYHQFSFLF